MADNSYKEGVLSSLIGIEAQLEKIANIIEGRNEIKKKRFSKSSVDKFWG